MSAPSAAQPVDDAGDAVGLLDAQLARAADHGLALGEAAEQRHQRQLVDRQRYLVRGSPRADRAGRRPRRARRPAPRCAARRSAPPGPRGSPRPSAAAMRKNAVRVQFRPMSLDHDRANRATSAAAAAMKAAEDGIAGHGAARRARARRPRRPDTVSPSRSNGTRARHEHPLGVVAAARRLGDAGRAPTARSAGDQHARLDLRAGHGQLVVDPVQGAPRDRGRGEAPLARVERRAPIGRSGTAMRSTGRRRIDSSPSSVHDPPGCPASQPGSRRSSVPELPTSRRPPVTLERARAGRRRGSTSAPSLLVDARRRAPRIASSVESVSCGVQVVAYVTGSSHIAAEQRRAVRDRLVGRRAAPCREAAGRGSKRALVMCRAPRGTPSSSISASARVGVVVARDPERHLAGAHVLGRRERHVGDVDPRAARARAPPAATIPGPVRHRHGAARGRRRRRDRPRAAGGGRRGAASFQPSIRAASPARSDSRARRRGVRRRRRSGPRSPRALDM